MSESTDGATLTLTGIITYNRQEKKQKYAVATNEKRSVNSKRAHSMLICLLLVLK